MNKVLKNISYDLYLISLGILAFFSFIGKIDEYILLIYVGIALILVMAKKSIFYIIPIAVFITMSTTELRENVTAITAYAIIVLTIFIIDIVRNRKLTFNGYLFLPLLLYIILSIFTSVNGPDNFSVAIGFTLTIVMMIFYVYFISTLEPNQENYMKLSKMFMYLALLVSFEMLFQVYEQGEEAINFIQRRRINLQWENLNIIIYVNLVAIPFIGYLITKVKFKLPYMMMGAIVTLGIFLTLSRSSILSVGFYIVLLVPTIIYLEPKKYQLILQGLIMILFIVMGIYFLERYNAAISKFLIAITSRDWTNTENRTELLDVAWAQFKQYPIIGSGGLYSSSFYLPEAGFASKNYHNILATAASLGILGLINFAFLFYRKTKLIMLSKSSFKWYALIMIYVTAFVNGMFQPMYFYTTYMIYVILVLAVIEVNIKGKTEDLTVSMS